MVDLQQIPISNPAPDEQRDYPLQIFTLGRFSVARGLEPIRFARKAQHRPLQLLKALIALGGREVGSDRLGMALWPESEGDTAYNAFEITLHRLRKLLGIEKSLVLSNGLLTLDNQLCWVDVWAFEQAAGQAEMLLRSLHPNPDELAGISFNVVTLYHGHFLGRETPEPWSISLRERLRSKFLRHLLDVARHWEKIGQHEAAIQCYQKGLETDDLAEIFYQRLMVCYQQLGRKSEALAVYRRCRTTLSLILSIAPSPATETIRRRLTEV
ncbi:BTAD domain-containing putative transcriptional regulator [Sulfuricaulis sp.]|jgi:DNA-binding SARP family transcriptional activator|uniref:AfsR/SARP family transcriptional regulator n=1 Tax=Sulfuricaulis sp. TaxID=2003553 RepID=UPI00355964F9